MIEIRLFLVNRKLTLLFTKKFVLIALNLIIISTLNDRLYVGGINLPTTAFYEAIYTFLARNQKCNHDWNRDNFNCIEGLLVLTKSVVKEMD